MKKFKISTIAAIAVYAMLAVVFQGCQWKHDGKILKDKDGKEYSIVGRIKRLEERYLKRCTCLAIAHNEWQYM